MADPIQGTLEIQADPGGETRIVLNPASADVMAGGNGQAGDVILRNGSGSEVIRLGRISESVSSGPGAEVPTLVADYTGLRIRTSGGVNLVQVGKMPASTGPVGSEIDDVEIVLGGSGFSGRLILQDSDGKKRLILGQDNQGAEGRLIVLSAGGKELLEFDPVSATLFVGGQGSEGDVVVRDQNDKERIRLSAGDGDVTVSDAGGNTLFHFDSQFAALYVGGTGNEGDVVIRDQDNKERIKLSAGDGDIFVRDGTGTDLLYFDSQFAALYVGGKGNEGDVVVRNGDGAQTIKLDGGLGDIILTNADCAEEFDVAESVEPGTVLVIDDDERLIQSSVSYDRRVAGVVSGAGSLRPGIILDRRLDSPGRPPVALMGKVHCKVDATFGPIGVGDLLVSSATPGHAMRATDPSRWHGAVLGKALRSWEVGRGLIPILVTLQ